MPQPSDITLGVVLAAGLSRRFGPDNKLTYPWQGRPMLGWPLAALHGATLDHRAAVVSDPAVAALVPPSFQTITLPTGLPMASSFAAAVDHAVAIGAARLLVCLGDMPGIDTPVLQSLLAMGGSAACVHDGARMPPMVLDAADFAAARAGAKGDRGARAFLQSLAPSQLLPLNDTAARDVDTPP
ncbi:molybdenum cofactor cytidylyltransferase [Ketogulonicigenium robustum]|uniref:Molybdenum cofactor cytidylyltransferase n=2 Tax=Ketogulonicigenium robustum TaxID=92947 RepID=A0A1W6NW48_9RHOB|nr:molybdenum cofactor cytidylyltransferase [Ketogulonicigenium robustum]